jgi:hypothetical protein
MAAATKLSIPISIFSLLVRDDDLIVEALRLDARLEEPAEGGADGQEYDNPEERDEECQTQAGGRHEKVKEEDVDDDWSEESERQWDVAIDQEEDSGHELEEENDNQIVGDKKSPDKLAGNAGGHGRGNEMKETIQPENEKNEAENITSDDRSDFHVNFLCLISIILTSIYFSSRNYL